MKLGYHLAPWIRDGHLENFHRALDEIALTGWDGLELLGPWVVERWGERPGELRDLLALHGLELSSCYLGLSYLPTRRIQETELVKRVIATAAEAGSSTVLIDGCWRKPEETTEQDYADVAAFANQIGAWAGEAGLGCCWHQHWGTLFETAEPFARLMALTDPALVGFCPDTAQLSMGDFDLLATLRQYGHRIGYVHLKDLDTNHNWAVTAAHGGPATWSDTGAYHVDSRWRFVELGRGLIDFPAVVEILRGAHYDGWIVDDFDYSAYATREGSAACLGYLRDSLGLLGRRGHDGPWLKSRW